MSRTMLTQTTHSPALVEAAQADRTRLQEAWEELQAQRVELAAELDQLESSLDELHSAMRRLGEIIGDEVQLPLLEPTQSAPVAELSGAAIRSVAVDVAIGDSRREFPWHYTDWYKAVVEAGHAIKGADPQAVFLTQLSRSPLTTRCSESGCYRLNQMALVELAAQLDDLHSARNELLEDRHADRPTENFDLSIARLQQITADVGRTERRLNEALATVRDVDPAEWFARPRSSGLSELTRTTAAA